MNNSAPLDASVGLFLLPIRQPDRGRSPEILVELNSEQVYQKTVYSLATVFPTFAAWEAAHPVATQPPAKVEPEGIFLDTIRLGLEKSFGAKEYLLVGLTTPFFFPPPTDSERAGHVTLAIGVVVQLESVELQKNQRWVSFTDLTGPATAVRVPSKTGRRFPEMLDEAARLFVAYHAGRLAESFMGALAKVVLSPIEPQD